MSHVFMDVVPFSWENAEVEQRRAQAVVCRVPHLSCIWDVLHHPVHFVQWVEIIVPLNL